MWKFLTLLMSATCGGMLLYSAPTSAHDLQGLVAERNSLEPEVREMFDRMQQLRARLSERARAAPGDGQLEAVVQRALKWPSGRATVCFFDGRAEAREHVADVATGWSQGAGLEFDFGPKGARRTCEVSRPSDIRVSFRGAGYYSYVGTQAKYINANKQTLNLQGMDRASFSAQDDGIILHEFGHAIGFEHEHQSPVAGCEEEFNWNYLYTSMGWTKQEVDRNMRRLSTPSSKTGLLTTTFDRASVMLYSLSPLAFSNASTAKCFIPSPNNDISDLDRQAAQTVYPAAAGGPPEPASAPVTSENPEAVSIQQALRSLRDFSEGPKTP